MTVYHFDHINNLPDWADITIKEFGTINNVRSLEECDRALLLTNRDLTTARVKLVQADPDDPERKRTMKEVVEWCEGTIRSLEIKRRAFALDRYGAYE